MLLAGGAALGSVVGIAAGDGHSLAVRSDGSLVAWGLNAFGQLGDGSGTNRPNPVTVIDSAGSAFTGVVQAAAGQGISAALRNDGTVWIWGFYAGVTALPLLRPAQVLLAGGGALTGVSRIAAGRGCVLAIKTDGTLWAWGLHGNGSSGLSTVAVPVETAPGVGLGGIVEAAVGVSNAAAVAADGRVFTWGSGNLGRTASLSSGVWAGPVVDGAGAEVTGVARAAVGNAFTVLLLADGSLRSFGSNSNAQLGANSTNLIETNPVSVRDSSGNAFGSGQRVSISTEHTLVVRRDGSVWGWGRNANLQLARPADPPVSYFYANPIAIAL